MEGVRALVAALGRRGRRRFLRDLAPHLSLRPHYPGGSGRDSVHPHPTPSRPLRHPRAHSVAPEGKLSGEGDVPGAGLPPPLKALTLPRLRTPPHLHPTVRVQLSGAGLLRRGGSPQSAGAETSPGFPSHSLQSPWPGAVGRGGGGMRRRDRGLSERLFGGFEGLREGEREPSGLNTKERLRKGEGLGREWGQGSACRKGSLGPGCGARRMQRIYLCPTLPWPRPTRKAAVRTQLPFPYPGSKAEQSLQSWHCPKDKEDPYTSHRPGLAGVSALSTSLSSCCFLNAHLPEKLGVLGCRLYGHKGNSSIPSPPLLFLRQGSSC